MPLSMLLRDSLHPERGLNAAALLNLSSVGTMRFCNNLFEATCFILPVVGVRSDSFRLVLESLMSHH